MIVHELTVAGFKCKDFASFLQYILSCALDSAAPLYVRHIRKDHPLRYYRSDEPDGKQDEEKADLILIYDGRGACQARPAQVNKISGNIICVNSAICRIVLWGK